MINPCCYICLNKKRPVKYISDSIQVCQWCVTILQDNPINPKQIEQHLMDIVKEHSRKPPSKPDKTGIQEQAQSQVTNEESFCKFIFTSLFNKKEREKLIKIRYKTLCQKAEDSYVNELKKYKSEIDYERKESYRKLLSGEYMPKELTYFFAKRDIFSSRWSSPIRGAYKDSLDSIDKKYLKYIRAYNYHLLSGNKKSLRLYKNVTQELSRQIKKRDKYNCKICSKSGSDIELHVHHIIPLGKYGSNHPNNLITLCYSCHNKQHPGFAISRNLPIKRKRTGGEFVSIDIETTGFSHNNDHIIEIAAVKFSAAQVIEDFSSLINPKVPIPYKITQLTGIDDKMVFNSPSIDTIFHEFIKFIGNFKLVIHNASFDMRFLKKYADEFGYQINNEIIDTLNLSKKKNPTLNNHKLQTLVHHFNITTNGKHRALADSYATGQIYIKNLRIKGK